MRINKYLSLSGLGSRRKVEELIKDGSIRLNDKIVTNMGQQIEENDEVFFKGKILSLIPSHLTIAFNKPKGCLCSKNDPLGRALIYDYIPQKYSNLNYIGRLDYNSRGLLLLTTDGDFVQKLCSPKSQISRTYRVKLSKPIKESHIAMLAKGISIDNVRYRPIQVRSERKVAYFTLTEGKNREIRHIMETLFYRVGDLQRVSFGSIILKELGISEGKFRFIDAHKFFLN